MEILKLPVTFLVYGSLRSPEVLRRVLGRSGYTLDTQVSHLSGFKAYFLKDENYPVVIKERDALLPYQCLEIQTLDCLKRCYEYEGEEDYQLMAIGENYLFYPTPEFLAQNILDSPFDYDRWFEEHHEIILKKITQWGLDFIDC